MFLKLLTVNRLTLNTVLVISDYAESYDSVPKKYIEKHTPDIEERDTKALLRRLKGGKLNINEGKITRNPSSNI